jgi:hypothetical protein
VECYAKNLFGEMEGVRRARVVARLQARTGLTVMVQQLDTVVRTRHGVSLLAGRLAWLVKALARTRAVAT